ncbi:MAG: triose-phosphate isomerase [Micropepsaceae bacterium]
MTRSPDAPRPLAAGNWKMNGLGADAAEIALLAAKLVVREAEADVLICPPATLLARMAVAFEGQGIAFGGQDCHAAVSGAHTGDISAGMIADAGGSYVIVGHSERRAGYGETDAAVAAKAAAAHNAGLIAIVCVGETLAEREAGKALAVVDGQVQGSLPPGATAENTVIAYEPVWAIGTGKTPSLADIAEMHAGIRARLGDAGFRILYGGSVKPANAAEILGLANVDGALVGGASLKAADFDAIINAYR